MNNKRHLISQFLFLPLLPEGVISERLVVGSVLLLFVGASVTGALTLIDALDVLVLRVGVLVFVKIVLPIFSADLLVCIG